MSTPSVVRSAAWDEAVLASASIASPLCTDVKVDEERIADFAEWMCFEYYEPLGNPPALENREQVINLEGLLGAINFAYTDFDTKTPWSIVKDGVTLVDADALRARFDEAIEAGVPVTTGEWLANVTEKEFAELTPGPFPIPMIPERVAVLNAIGRTLVEKYDGSFTNFVDSCPSKAYDDGNGFLERLIAEFPRFDDSAELHGVPVRIDKLAQLLVWFLHRVGAKPIDDIDKLSIFADYICPGALRAMRILTYSPELAAAVDAGEIVPANSQWEVEIRVQTLYSMAVLTDKINARRVTMGHEPLVNPQVDYRFWAGFHDLMWPHHLTITNKY